LREGDAKGYDHPDAIAASGSAMSVVKLTEATVCGLSGIVPRAYGAQQSKHPASMCGGGGCSWTMFQDVVIAAISQDDGAV